VPASKKRKSEAEDSSSKNKRQAVPEGEDVPDEENPKVYVRGLPWRATHQEVKDFFTECGAIKSVELPLMGDGRSSGTAIIEFDSPEGSAKAMEQNGADFNGRWLNSKFCFVACLSNVHMNGDMVLRYSGLTFAFFLF
jgi:RNA recognition motif-containing protein